MLKCKIKLVKLFLRSLTIKPNPENTIFNVVFPWQEQEETGSEPVPTRARVVRLLMTDFEGDAPGLNSVRLTDTESNMILPVSHDFDKLAQNETLEVIPGDRISITYTDPSFITPENEVLEEFVDVTFHDAEVEACFVDYEEIRGEREAVYIPMSAFLNYNTRVVGGTVPLTKGNVTSFRTELVDNEVSLAIARLGGTRKSGEPGSAGKPSHEVRLGYYRSEWERPSDANFFTVGGLPTVLEAEYRTSGYFLSVETIDSGRPGLNLDLSMRWGTKNSMKTAVDWERFFGKKVEVNSVAVGLGLWYNHYFGERGDTGAYLSLGGNWLYRAVNVDVITETQTNVSAASAVNDTDTVYRLFAVVGYRF